MKLYGGIETGGTKIVCMVAGGPDKLWLKQASPQRRQKPQ